VYQKAKEMGKNGRKRAVDNFSFEILALNLQSIVEGVTTDKKKKVIHT